jgi:hypothetical protein
MPPNNILWVTSNPKSPERDDEYNTWYNNVHLFQILKVPGFVAATRYKISSLQMEWFPPAASTPEWPFGKDRYLTIYEIDPATDPRDLFSALRATEKQRYTLDPENEPVAWGEQWFYEAFTEREPSVWLRPEGPAPEKPNGEPFHIFIVPISPLSPELEEDFNKFYIAQGNIRRRGISAGIRYKLSRTQGTIDSRASAPAGEWPFGQHSYLMIYELYDALAAHEALRPARARTAEGTGGQATLGRRAHRL